jgi:ribosomal protein S12 methylthiotransferase accessory factor
VGYHETHILNVARVLADDRVGIIAQVRQLPKDKGAPDFVYASARTCSLNVLSPNNNGTTFIGTGVATDRSRAMAKAMGESIERYCSANLPMEEVHFATSAAADFPCVSPEEFVLFGSHQYKEADFPYVPFTPHTRVGWTPALDLHTKRAMFVPAAMVWLSYEPFEGDAAITQQISTGLACHSNPTVAAIKAICEVVERDAIAVTWLGKIPQPQIRLETLSLQNRELLARLKQPGASVTLLHLQTDHGIPVIFSIMQSRVPDAPAIVVAAAAHLDPEQAVRKSLEELAQIWCFSQVVNSNRSQFKPGIGWANVTDMESHAMLYFSHKNKHLFRFLLPPSEQISFHDITNYSIQESTRDLRILIERIAATNHRVLLKNITCEDVQSLGLWVFRALIPGFHPLFMGHRLRALGTARVQEVRKRLGFTAPLQECDLNQTPHPFS